MQHTARSKGGSSKSILDAASFLSEDFWVWALTDKLIVIRAIILIIFSLIMCLTYLSFAAGCLPWQSSGRKCSERYFHDGTHC